MKKSRHRMNCDGPLSCGGEGQAAQDAITYTQNDRSLSGVRRVHPPVAQAAVWRPSCLHLFLEPRNHARRCRSDMFHAAPASRSRRVAGPRGVHAYSVPPVFFQVINPAHRFRLQNLSSRKTEICMETFAGWQKGFAGS